MLRILHNFWLLLVVLRVVRFKSPAGFHLVVCLELHERRVITLVEQTGTEHRGAVAFLAHSGQNLIDSHLNIKCMEVGHGVGCMCGVPGCAGDPLAIDIGPVEFDLSHPRKNTN